MLQFSATNTMKLETYHETYDNLTELSRQALKQGNKDISSALEDIRSKLKYCWGETVEREEANIDSE